jgi:membrane protein implicated in regulation of membrane protease activity
MDYLWIVWLVVGIALAVAEAFTLGFFLLWFGIGALAAAVVALVGGGVVLQVLVFLAVSAALTAASRTIWEHVFFRNRPGVKMGMAALPGQVATVVESSRGALGEGAVKVFGSTWTAYPAEGEAPLEQGESVTVERVEGAVLYVKRSRPPGELWRT